MAIEILIVRLFEILVIGSFYMSLLFIGLLTSLFLLTISVFGLVTIPSIVLLKFLLKIFLVAIGWVLSVYGRGVVAYGDKLMI